MTHLEISAARSQDAMSGPPYHSWVLMDGTLWTEFYREGADYLLRFPGYADYVLSGRERTVVCIPVPGTDRATIEHLYLNQVLPLVLGKAGKLVFHGSAVAVDGHAIAFAAPAGRGKSTLAASFAVHGHAFLTDDGLQVDDCEGGFAINPSHPSIRLWADSHAALIGEAARTAPPLGYTSKSRIVAGGPLRYCSASQPLLAAYFLRSEQDAALSFTPLSPAEALIEWVRHSFLLDVADQNLVASQFTGIAELARRVPCFLLNYRRCYEGLADVRQNIIAHAFEQGPPS